MNSTIVLDDIDFPYLGARLEWIDLTQIAENFRIVKAKELENALQHEHAKVFINLYGCFYLSATYETGERPVLTLHLQNLNKKKIGLCTQLSFLNQLNSVI